MAKKSKKPKFFCEYCDSEVPYNARFCQKCGHFFLSVKCPACGKTGNHDEFKNGCPICGYAFDSSVEDFKSRNKSLFSDAENMDELPKENRKTRKNPFGTFISSVEEARSKRPEDALPPWIYVSTISILIVLLFVLFSLQK